MTETYASTGQLLTAMTNAEWLAMNPAQFDAMVAELMADPKADFWANQIWGRLTQIEYRKSAKKTEPLTRAAFTLARARMCLPTSRQDARGWLREAQKRAGVVNLTDVFDIEQLQSQASQLPQVVNGRFAPDACRPSAFQDECQVVCPKCGGAAVEADKVVRCGSCLYRAEYDGDSVAWEQATSPWFQLRLLLNTSTTHGDIWVYNVHHLHQLRCYVAATVRDERHSQHASWSSRLPTWMKTAKNRDMVLKALDKLAQIAAESGLM